VVYRRHPLSVGSPDSLTSRKTAVTYGITQRMTSRSRILIADDHTLVAELCRKLLETEFDVVGTVSDGRALVRAAGELKPDVVVVDVAMPVLNGLDAGRQVKEMLPAIKLIYLTMNPDLEIAAEAFRRGAHGYLLKTCAAAELVLAVRDVLRGKSFMSPILPRDTVNFLRKQDKKMVNEDDRLTQRQREVLQLLAEGKVMKEVSNILHMSTRTVAYHKYRMMEVLGAKSTAELVKYAIRNHIVAA
jgi:DNA-binding NarL/FixJ family response regulator